jgi:hypothetical protein
VPGLGGIDERKRERADPELRCQMDGLAIRAGHPDRRMRFLHGLRQHVARRHREIRPGEPRIGIHHHHGGDLLYRLPPHGAPIGRIDAEALQLGPGSGLAGPPIDAASGDEVERRHPFGHARRVVVAGRHEHDPVSETDAPGALRGRRQEHLRRRGLRVFLEEVVLDLPGVVDAEPIRQLHLRERILEQLELGALVPGTRQLVLVEDPEFHGAPFAPSRRASPDWLLEFARTGDNSHSLHRPFMTAGPDQADAHAGTEGTS